MTNDAKLISVDSFLEKSKSEVIVIYRNGQQVIAKDKSTGKTATAKCHPDDNFDFKIGAKLALDRLIGEEKPKFKPYLKGCRGTHYGKIGEPTTITDTLGNPLFVGDVVRLFSKDGEEAENKFVAKDDDDKNGFVMGIKGCCKGGSNHSGWFVVKIKSFSDVEHLEEHDFVTAILK